MSFFVFYIEFVSREVMSLESSGIFYSLVLFSVSGKGYGLRGCFGIVRNRRELSRVGCNC